MTANLTMTDLFCGAGGSTTGAGLVPGIEVRLAANHWGLAIETHNTNHPDVDHFQADISQTDPRYVPHTDLLWASPECTNHSRASGRHNWTSQPDLFGETLTSDAVVRSRATMWDVVRFTEAHRYRAIVVENVIEIADWGDPTTCRGGLFQAWLHAMTNLGYNHRVLCLNSMHAQMHGFPAPQSRDRVYVVFWQRNLPAPDLEPIIRPQAWCPSCGEVVASVQAWKRLQGDRTGRYRSQYVYRCAKTSCRGQIVEPGWLPASSVIDWTNLGVRIGDRDRPLATKTLARIEAGIARYWAPLVIESAGNTWDAAAGSSGSYVRAWPTSDPLRTISGTMSKALVVPVEGRSGKQATPIDQPMRTLTTRNETGLVISYYGRTQGAKTTDDPLPTVTAAPRFALLMRNQSSLSDPGFLSTPASEPVRTLTATASQSLLSTDHPTVSLDDVRFRMLEPDEIKLAMAFPDTYRMLGTRREQVRLAGNAVTPPAARDIMTAVYEAITGEAA